MARLFDVPVKDNRDNPGPATLSVKQALTAILRYCNGAPKYSQLETVEMLCNDALWAYDEEQKALTKQLDSAFKEA